MLKKGWGFHSGMRLGCLGKHTVGAKLLSGQQQQRKATVLDNVHLHFHFGVLMGGIRNHFEVMCSSQIVLEVPWELCSRWKLILWVPARPFWKVSGSVWQGCWIYFSILCRYRFSQSVFIWFWHDFSWISIPFGQAKFSKQHGGLCKNELCMLFAMGCVWKLILDGFWTPVGSDFGS